MFAVPRFSAISFAAALFTCSASLFAAPTTPTSAFTDNNDGTVSHKISGLTWKRCAEGQSWTGTTCTGTAATYAWEDAKTLTSSFAGKSDWRLPTMAELVTLVEGDNSNPAINTGMFPNTPASDFWSSSLVAEGQGYAWRVGFYFGDNTNDKSNSVHARLVRGGQAQDASGLFTPTADFTDNGDGTVVHKKTSLTWKRCAEGMSWTGSTCTGTAKTYTWADANALSSAGWRLPTKNELLTIVEWGKTAPAINATIFPSTPSTAAWSASAYLGNSNWAWYINFGNGNDYANYKTNTLTARLVRGEQTAPSYTAPSPDCLFNWAEKSFPQYFSTGAKSQTLDVYTYRQYGSNTYLAVSSKDNHVWAILAGGAPLDAGAATGWYATAGCQ